MLQVGLLAPAVLGLVGAARAQARPPLRVTQDSSGVLSAIRAIDFRQLCRCPTVMLDSTIRQARRISMFGVLAHPAWATISSTDAARLKLARHRVRRTAIGRVVRKGRDSVFVATQLVAASDSARRILLVATPPSGTTEAFLIALTLHRARWRVVGVRSVYDP